MNRLLLILLAASVVLACGCTKNQTVKDSWKYTTKQYRTYLNTPASLDMEATGSCENYELALGDAVLDVDDQLQKFVRAMENSDRSPDQEWVMGMMRKFPWLTGVALVDGSGQRVAQYPEYFMKEFDISPLLSPDPKQRIGSLRAYVQQTPLGPEVYLANPVYMGAELRGLITAYFDPRALVSLSKDPGSFMMASPAGVVWAGRFNAESTPVGKTKWEELLLKESCGVIGGSGAEFYWTTRYLGNLPLVYAIPTDAKALTETSDHLNELKKVDVSDAPPMKLDPSLSPGEVGNVGMPSVMPTPAAPGSSGPKTQPLEQ